MINAQLEFMSAPFHNAEGSNFNSDVTNDNDKIGHHKHFFVKIMKIDIEQYDVLN